MIQLDEKTKALLGKAIAQKNGIMEITNIYKNLNGLRVEKISNPVILERLGELILEHFDVKVTVRSHEVTESFIYFVESEEDLIKLRLKL